MSCCEFLLAQKHKNILTEYKATSYLQLKKVWWRGPHFHTKQFQGRELIKGFYMNTFLYLIIYY